jgi:hypothetical protein
MGTGKKSMTVRHKRLKGGGKPAKWTGGNTKKKRNAP